MRPEADLTGALGAAALGVVRTGRAVTERQPPASAPLELLELVRGSVLVGVLVGVADGAGVAVRGLSESAA